MFEFFTENVQQNSSERPKKHFSLLARVREVFSGFTGRDSKDSQPKKVKEKVSPETINFNQEQIHLAMEKIREQLKKTKKKKGIIACEELIQKDKDEAENIFSLRYTVDDEARINDGYYGSGTLSFRIEMFRGNKQEISLIKPCFVLQEGLKDDWSSEEGKISPVAYRQIYYHRLAQIDPVEDGLTLQGFSYTSKEHRGLGVATKIFEELHADDLIRDFIKRTKHSWPRHRLPENIKEADCIFTDTTYLYGGSNRFWTTRLMERLGIERADWKKYQYRDEDIFVKKTSLV